MTMQAVPRGWRLYGVDFTSAPRAAKTITIARGTPTPRGVRLEALRSCPDWPAFEAFLGESGPWLGAFDFPFGLPREAVADLGWPQDWPALVRHCRQLGRADFRRALDAYRESRPPGRRYAHRASDHAAKSHSPLKLVNPPVGLMFLEGAPRLLDAGLTLPGMHAGAADRIAIEAYPGALARTITNASYKSDERRKQTPERLAARGTILAALCSGDHPLDLILEADETLRGQLVDDGSGDLLDAVLALIQAAWALRAGAPRYGLPDSFDPVEGWIIATG